MSDHEEEYGEEQEPQLDYNEQNDEGFSKIEYQIYESLIEAKEKHRKNSQPDDPDEEPEPFDFEGWLEEFKEKNPKIDEKRISFVTKFGVYSGERDELQVRQGSGKCFFPNGDRYTGQYEEGQRCGQGFYEYRSLGIDAVDAAIHKYLEEDEGVKKLVEGENYQDAAKAVMNSMTKKAAQPPTTKKSPRAPQVDSYHRVFYTLRCGTPYPYYDGEFKENLNEGQGIMKYNNGAVYKGEWQMGKKQGYGVLYYNNGDYFKGEWDQGLKHGSGSYFFSKFDCTFEGEWKNGKFVEGVWKMPDGIFYQGKFDDIPVDVNGRFVFGDGVSLSGEFRDKMWRPSNRFTVESRDE